MGELRGCEGCWVSFFCFCISLSVGELHVFSAWHSLILLYAVRWATGLGLTARDGWSRSPSERSSSAPAPGTGGVLSAVLLPRLCNAVGVLASSSLLGLHLCDLISSQLRTEGTLCRTSLGGFLLPALLPWGFKASPKFPWSPQLQESVWPQQGFPSLCPGRQWEVAESTSFRGH